MRTMMRGKHGKKSRFPALAALALCAVLIVTFMPNLLFSSRAEEIGKQKITQIQSINESGLVRYVLKGTAKDKLGLPTQCTVVLDGGKTETLDIAWTGNPDYNSNTVGQYTLKPDFGENYSYDGNIRAVIHVEQAYGTVTDQKTFTNPTAESLGSVGHLGVFANIFHAYNDYEGSAAADTLDASSHGEQAIGATSNVDATDNYLYFNHIKNGTTFKTHGHGNVVFGSGISLNTDTSDNNSHNSSNEVRLKLSDTSTGYAQTLENGSREFGDSMTRSDLSSYQINFEEAFNGLKAYSLTQYKKENHGVQKTEKDGTITITCDPDFDIINLTASELENNKLNIVGKDGTTNYSLIINVKELSDDEVTLTHDITVSSTIGGYKGNAGKALFNFGPDYTDIAKFSGGNGTGAVTGCILAPSASVLISGATHNGSVYAKEVENKDCEIHQNDFTPVTPTYPSIAFAVNKSFTGNYPDGKTFTFRLSGGKVENGKVTDNVTNTATVKEDSLGKNSFFELITYRDAGTYKYTVSENIPEDANNDHISGGVKYDPTVYDVEVVTSKDSAGNVKIDTVKYKKSSDTEYKSMDISNLEAFTFSNSSAPSSTTSVSVKKEWKDNNNQDGKRPSSITVKLLKNNKDQIDSKTVSAADEWKYKFEKLPENDTNGNKIIYSVAEADVPEGYTSKVTGNAKTGFTITNTHTPETTSVSGTKTWDDSDNQDGKRPKSITVNLLKNGTVDKSMIISASNDWKYSFANLPKYDNGKEITYTITEDAVADYSTKIDGYNITNSYTPGKTSVTVTKAWNDNNNADKKRPDSVQVQLYANGEKSGDPVALSESTNWTYTWPNLDAKKSGTDIKYTVKELNTPDGYTSNVSGDAKTGFTITNTENTTPPTPNPQPTYTTYTVHKVWDLGSGETVPDSVQMQLYKNGTAYGSPVTVTRASGWTYTWTVLPQTENGKLNTWSVKEVDPDNQYTATVVNGTSSATVTNRSNNNAGGKTQVSVHKVWKLDNGRTAASSVQAQLYRNGEAYGDPVTLSARNSWSHVWTGLTKTDAQGNTISWTVREVNVPSGFTSTVTGTDRSFTITNDDKPQDNHNKNNKPVNPNNNNNKPVTPNTNNKKNTPVNPGTPSIPKNTGTVVNRGTSAGSTPRTGDQTSLGFWLAMLTAGAAGTAAAVLLKRRKSADEDRD